MSQQDKNSGAEYWRHRWANHIIPFHRPAVHPYLKEFEDYFSTSNKKLHTFFPMCGKMTEMKWFYERGHTVVGVEIAEKAINDFFRENHVVPSESHCPNVKCQVFQTIDRQLRIFCCDVYDFLGSKPGMMDVVFDRATLCIMESQEQRQKYVELIKPLLAPGYTYLLTTFKHDDESYKGLPRNVTDSNVKELFGKIGTLEKVSELQEVTVPGLKSPLIEVTWRITG